MSVRAPLSIPKRMDHLKHPTGNYHPPIQENSLKLVAWTFSGKTYGQREFQQGLQTTSSTSGAQAHSRITNRLEANGLAGVLDRK